MKGYYRIFLVIVITLGAVILFRFLIGESTVTLFSPQGMIAAAERDLILRAFALMALIVIPTLLVLFFVAWRYRAGNGADYDPESSHRKPWKEIILWIIPGIFVVVLGVMTWQSAHFLDPYNPISASTQSMTIQVVALEWKWLFIYPEQGIATVNFVEFPEKTPIHFELTADAPVSSFWIPQLGSQIYTMAGMQTQLHLIANETGEFAGKDNEINGAGYSGMNFVAKSVSPMDFQDWVASVKQSSPGLTHEGYLELAKPSEENPSATYSSVEGDLFDSIMMRYMTPAAPSSSFSHEMPGMQM